MIIQGEYPIEASIQDVWIRLLDPEVLKRVTPGISELNSLGADKFQAISNIKTGPVKGIFEGQLGLKCKSENSTVTIVVDQKSKIGNVSAKIKIQMNAADDTTEIDYKGEAKLSDKLTMMGQRIIDGIIRSLSKQFFKSLDKEINS